MPEQDSKTAKNWEHIRSMPAWLDKGMCSGPGCSLLACYRGSRLRHAAVSAGDQKPLLENNSDVLALWEGTDPEGSDSSLKGKGGRKGKGQRSAGQLVQLRFKAPKPGEVQPAALCHVRWADSRRRSRASNSVPGGCAGAFVLSGVLLLVLCGRLHVQCCRAVSVVDSLRRCTGGYMLSKVVPKGRQGPGRAASSNRIRWTCSISTRL